MLKKYWKICLFTLFIFLGLLFFFNFINPLTVFDADDWLYIYSLRKPIPILHDWNPTRVFPEVVMPLISYFGAYVFYPITNNYFRSLSIAHGLFASIFLTIYFVQFVVLFYKRNFATLNRSIAYGFLFILLHFISHIIMGSNNFYMLASINLTSFYFYTLSAILNAILVMHFMSYGGVKEWFKNSNLFHKLIVFIGFYFAINSNLFSSVILATYIGANLLLILIKKIKNKTFNLISYCGENWLELIIIICWFGVNVIETTGGRAYSIHKNILLTVPPSLLMGLLSLIAKNVFVTILDIVVFISWYRLKNKKLNATSIRFILYITFTLVYEILLSSTSDPTYVLRSEVSMCTFFYLFMGMIACLNELIQADNKKTKLPLILAGTILCLFINPGNLYKRYNYSNIPVDKCEKVMDDLIKQIKTAQENGEKEIVLVIPKFEEDDGNWPLSYFIGDRVANALYKHNVVDSYITIKDVKASKEKNDEFGIDTISWLKWMMQSVQKKFNK